MVNAYLALGKPKEAAAAAGVVSAAVAGAAVEEVEYSAAENPNRLTLRLVAGASPNAERIELFTNAREAGGILKRALDRR